MTDCVPELVYAKSGLIVGVSYQMNERKNERVNAARGDRAREYGELICNHFVVVVVVVVPGPD